MDDARVWARQVNHYYYWGMLLGCLCLTAAGIGLIGPNQTTVRKVVGAVVLGGQVVIVLLGYMIMSMVMGINNNFRP